MTTIDDNDEAVGLYTVGTVGCVLCCELFACQNILAASTVKVHVKPIGLYSSQFCESVQITCMHTKT